MDKYSAALLCGRYHAVVRGVRDGKSFRTKAEALNHARLLLKGKVSPLTESNEI